MAGKFLFFLKFICFLFTGGQGAQNFLNALNPETILQAYKLAKNLNKPVLLEFDSGPKHLDNKLETSDDEQQEAHNYGNTGNTNLKELIKSLQYRSQVQNRPIVGAIPAKYNFLGLRNRNETETVNQKEPLLKSILRLRDDVECAQNVVCKQNCKTQKQSSDCKIDCEAKFNCKKQEDECDKGDDCDKKDDCDEDDGCGKKDDCDDNKCDECGKKDDKKCPKFPATPAPRTESRNYE